MTVNVAINALNGDSARSTDERRSGGKRNFARKYEFEDVVWLNKRGSLWLVLANAACVPQERLSPRSGPSIHFLLFFFLVILRRSQLSSFKRRLIARVCSTFDQR